MNDVEKNRTREPATKTVPGVSPSEKKNKYKPKRRKIDVANLAEKTVAGDRAALARALTLVESSAAAHRPLSRELLDILAPRTGNSIRIAVSGSPGAGKSALIDALGVRLCDSGRKVAALAIDPSSVRSKGSILGDKTRMEKLAVHENAFVRPSPSGGALGGVARKTREDISVCEAAGYDRIIVETVGVGQSEIAARSMTDVFMLVLQPGAGDEIQGIKKGVVEIADILAVNKADGDNLNLAEITKKDYQAALHYLRPEYKNWTVPVLTCSAIENKNIDEILKTIDKFVDSVRQTGEFEKRRKNQALGAFEDAVERELKTRFFAGEEISEILPDIRRKLVEGDISPIAAADKLLELFFHK